MIGTLVYYVKSAAFVAGKHLSGFDVNPTPGFDPEGLEFFNRIIRKSKRYLEYGSGGSTIVASQFVELLVSTESDPVFAKAVRKVVYQRPTEIHLLNPKIGLTRQWGFPVMAVPTPARISRWTSYPRAPWKVFESRGVRPDTILIDGRFRIACMLESLLHVDQSTIILFDDYVGRNYGVVEQFADIVAFHGRMAEFRKSASMDTSGCRQVLDTAYALLD